MQPLDTRMLAVVPPCPVTGDRHRWYSCQLDLVRERLVRARRCELCSATLIGPVWPRISIPRGVVRSSDPMRSAKRSAS
jgi:hypothetical protein